MVDVAGASELPAVPTQETCFTGCTDKEHGRLRGSRLVVSRLIADHSPPRLTQTLLLPVEIPAWLCRIRPASSIRTISTTFGTGRCRGDRRKRRTWRSSRTGGATCGRGSPLQCRAFVRRRLRSKHRSDAGPERLSRLGRCSTDRLHYHDELWAVRSARSGRGPEAAPSACLDTGRVARPKLEGSNQRRRFAPLVCAGVRAAETVLNLLCMRAATGTASWSPPAPSRWASVDRSDANAARRCLRFRPHASSPYPLGSAARSDHSGRISRWCRRHQVAAARWDGNATAGCATGVAPLNRT